MPAAATVPVAAVLAGHRVRCYQRSYNTSQKRSEAFRVLEQLATCSAQLLWCCTLVLYCGISSLFHPNHHIKENEPRIERCGSLSILQAGVVILVRGRYSSRPCGVW
jgi:hypothetical protein